MKAWLFLCLARRKCRRGWGGVGLGGGGSLAIGADPEEFEFVGHCLEAVPFGDGAFEFVLKAFVNLHDARAFRADQMMMVRVLLGSNEFESRDSIAEIKSSGQPHFFKHVHRSIDCGKIAHANRQCRMDFFVRERVGVLPEQIEKRLSRSGDLAGLVSKAPGQFLQIVVVSM